MIITRKQLPEVYYKESRDFQFLGRLFDVILNYNKMNIDTMRHNPLSKEMDDSLVTLAAYTVGFESRVDYDVNDLKAVCSAFRNLLSKKGTKEAIETCIEVLLKSKNISESYSIIINNETSDISGYSRELNIYIPAKLNDIRLLEDLFNYILPTGYIINISNLASERPKAVLPMGVSNMVVRSGKFNSAQVGIALPTELPSTTSEINNEGLGITDNTVVTIPGTYPNDAPNTTGGEQSE